MRIYLSENDLFIDGGTNLSICAAEILQFVFCNETNSFLVPRFSATLPTCK